MKIKGYKSKSTWNYRVLAHAFKDGDTEDIYFSVHEVYYKKKKLEAYSEQPVTTGGASLKDIKWNLRQMKRALKKPVLWHGDRFPEEYKPLKKLK